MGRSQTKGFGNFGSRALVAALLATTALVGSVGTIPSKALAQASTQTSFNIPAGSLNRALATFGSQSGTQISYEASIANGKTSPGIQGAATREQAIARILQGSGLTYSFKDARNVLITRPPATVAGALPAGAIPLDTIDVQGENAWGPVNGIVATRSATGTKTDALLRETPASISVVSRKQIEEQGAQSVTDAVRGTPGVVPRGDAESRYDYMSVRGFQPTTFLNGLVLPNGQMADGFGHGVAQVEPYGLERIEVLRGSASALYGQVPAGGILNLVSKRPTETPFGEVQLQTGSYARKQVAFDVGGPVTQDGTLLYRLTGLARDADLPIDFQHDKRVFIAPSFTWRPTQDTTFTFLSSYQKVESSSAIYPEQGTLLACPHRVVRVEC